LLASFGKPASWRLVSLAQNVVMTELADKNATVITRRATILVQLIALLERRRPGYGTDFQQLELNSEMK